MNIKIIQKEYKNSKNLKKQEKNKTRKKKT